MLPQWRRILVSFQRMPCRVVLAAAWNKGEAAVTQAPAEEITTTTTTTTTTEITTQAPETTEAPDTIQDLEIIIDNEILQKLPESVIQTIHLKATLKNYRWLVTENSSSGEFILIS